MRTRTSVLFAAVVVICVALFTAIEVRAHTPDGVPTAQPGPLTCDTVRSDGMGSSSWRITAITGTNGEFPVSVSCTQHSSSQCAKYEYTIGRLASLNADHIVVAAAVDQDADDTSIDPSCGGGSCISIRDPGAGAQTKSFLQWAWHEYAIEYNASNASTVTVSVSVVAPTVPRTTTVFVNSGNTTESCVVAGPGVLQNRLQPTTTQETVSCAGGECTCTITYDPAGNITNVTTGGSCVLTTDNTLTINGEEVSFIPNQGITVGQNTSTCYPDGTCVCTASPCP
jgi:hypothetical protein